MENLTQPPAQQTFDYSSFLEPVSKEEIRAQLKRNVGNSVMLIATLAGVFAVVALFVIVIAIQSIYIGLAVVLGIAAVTIYFIRATAKKLVKLRRFAARNDLTYLDSQSPAPDEGAIFTTGSSRRFSSGFQANDGRFFIANFQYVISSGKSSRTIQWGVMRMRLSRSLPNVLLDNRTNNHFGIMSNLPASYGGGQKFELEGDFNQYYSVYAPAGYERDALYFLTPELMAMLVDNGIGYDYEIVDDYLYLYTQHAFTFNETTLPTLFQTILYFGTQFEDNISRYADTRVPNSKVLNVVGVQGRRLKKGVAWFTVIFVIIIVLFQLLQFLPFLSR